MKIVFISIILLISLFLSAYVYANYTRTLLVLDMRNSPELPRRFRLSTDPLPATINTNGLAELKIAGGAQFSKAAFNKILHRINAKHIIVFDLRQESHGFVNGNAVSWYGVRNADNSSKTHADIEAEQARLLRTLASEEEVVINQLVQKSAEGEVKVVKPTEYRVHDTSSEEHYVTSLGHQYKRFYVQDYHAPTTKEVDRFIQTVNKISKSKWIYFHCRAGIGRTTVFMTMFDMMRNAKQLSFEEIMDRQAALGGKDLRVLPAKTHYKYQWAADRLQFLKQFYQYARDNKDHYQTVWSKWQH